MLLVSHVLSTALATVSSLLRLHVKADQVTNAEREKTKRVVYAVVYGVGEETQYVRNNGFNGSIQEKINWLTF